MSMLSVATLFVIGAIALFVVGILVMIAKFYRKVDQGKALIVNKTRGIEPEVTFTGGVVLPIIHRAEVMEISLKTIEIARSGSEGLICMDNIRADIRVNFFVRVNKTKEDVLKVAQAIGCARASDRGTLEELFTAKFSEALKTVGKRLEFEELYTQRESFKDQIIEVIGKDLNGYVLDDCAIDSLEQTPLEALDPQNVLDSRGIRKITEITAGQNVETNELKQKERMDIGRQDLTADEAVFRFDQQRSEAEARKQKEIAVSVAKESNEAARVKTDEEKRTALVRQKAGEEVAIGEENKMRAVEVARKNRERELAVEEVRIRKSADLEEIGREREVELRRIAKERELEVERKNIADVVRARIAVQKTVAQEEERIKDLRVESEANRIKTAKIIGAEGDAQESLVKSVRGAEAGAQMAEFEAKKRLSLAQAELEAADKHARAKMRLADGIQATDAAPGLAQVKVKEADATATEKFGLAEARVLRERMEAEAAGEETQGMARVKVRDAQVALTEREGLVKADLTHKQLQAEAAGAEQKGLAAARVEEARAQAVEKMGEAEAKAIRERLVAEASGLAEKGQAMKALDAEGVRHEEFRFQLEKMAHVQLETLKARVEIAQAAATTMGRAMEQARINIVGGDGRFFDKFVKAVSMGHAVDGFVDSSDVAKNALDGYVEGDGNLLRDLKDVMARPALSAGGARDLALTAVLGKLAAGSDDATRAKLEALIERAREFGLDAALEAGQRDD